MAGPPFPLDWISDRDPPLLQKTPGDGDWHQSLRLRARNQARQARLFIGTCSVVRDAKWPRCWAKGWLPLVEVVSAGMRDITIENDGC